MLEGNDDDIGASERARKRAEEKKRTRDNHLD
jgi:hypothetical protein